MAQAIKAFKKRYPLFHYHLTNGNTQQVTERLDRGLIDFAMIVEPPNLSKYNYLEIPETNVWGLVMKKSDALAKKERVCFEDLIGKELICSEQGMKFDIARWCGEKTDMLNLQAR